ncbi:hypothetical protein llap_7276 [Limosa lapponica baueri]|uniref:Uncharacterized protein n=1 Tax=Limosa lapponica baueri TaxID=1758121 RepID=A0A2I0U8R5_LIMLA|nr:hypothetical protein llap_7276 [Limosa lapponica baueri]
MEQERPHVAIIMVPQVFLPDGIFQPGIILLAERFLSPFEAPQTVTAAEFDSGIRAEQALKAMTATASHFGICGAGERMARGDYENLALGATEGGP